VSDADYHRRQAAIFTRLSETARHPDTAAALLWLAGEHRAQVELSALCQISGKSSLSSASSSSAPMPADYRARCSKHP
jgi:hypothetical protein